MRAFTLMEILVVVGIIAILSAIVLGLYSPARLKARDAKRVSDLAQIQLAFGIFFDKCGVYPPNLNGVDYTCPNDSSIILKDYLSSIPVDPINTGEYIYSYITTDSPATYYKITAKFENIGNPAMRDSTCSDTPTFYCVVPQK